MADLFLQDVILPDRNGTDLYAILRAYPKTAEIPRIDDERARALPGLEDGCQAEVHQ